MVENDTVFVVVPFNQVGNLRSIEVVNWNIRKHGCQNTQTLIPVFNGKTPVVDVLEIAVGIGHGGHSKLGVKDFVWIVRRYSDHQAVRFVWFDFHYMAFRHCTLDVQFSYLVLPDRKILLFNVASLVTLWIYCYIALPFRAKTHHDGSCRRSCILF